MAWLKVGSQTVINSDKIVLIYWTVDQTKINAEFFARLHSENLASESTSSDYKIYIKDIISEVRKLGEAQRQKQFEGIRGAISSTVPEETVTKEVLQNRACEGIVTKMISFISNPDSKNKIIDLNKEFKPE